MRAENTGQKWKRYVAVPIYVATNIHMTCIWSSPQNRVLIKLSANRIWRLDYVDFQDWCLWGRLGEQLQKQNRNPRKDRYAKEFRKMVKSNKKPSGLSQKEACCHLERIQQRTCKWKPKRKPYMSGSWRKKEMTDIESSIWAASLTLGWMLMIWVLCCRNIDNERRW